jgi:crooked neck
MLTVNNRYEAKLKEYERARVIYKYALDRLPRSKSYLLHKNYTTFEKQFGEREGVEDVILSKRRVQYEEQIKENPKNYDVWFDFARLEETLGDHDQVREVYERAIANIPPTREKRHWRRYIYLWIFYALWEEMSGKDIDRTRQIYTECLKLIPHKQFTFAKIWLLKATFEIRQMNITAARKLLGQAIGMCPKDKLFKGYIDLETKLHEFSRCRTLYEKHIQFNPSNAATWIRFAELEIALEDDCRARAIFELAVSQEILDMPELVWKAYIDFEEESGEYENTRGLFERLLDKTDHVKVWISYAHFEINADESEEEESGGEKVSEEAKVRARRVFERAYKSLKERDLKEERVVLLNAWKSFEQTHGEPEDVERVEKQLPKRVKKRRKLDDDSYEEYMDYLFPDDEKVNAGMLKLVQAAHQWKLAKARMES